MPAFHHYTPAQSLPAQGDTTGEGEDVFWNHVGVKYNSALKIRMQGWPNMTEETLFMSPCSGFDWFVSDSGSQSTDCSWDSSPCYTVHFQDWFH